MSDLRLIAPGNYSDVSVETSAIGEDCFIDDAGWDGATLLRWTFNRRGASIGAAVNLVDVASHGDIHIDGGATLKGGSVERTLTASGNAVVEGVQASQVQVDESARVSGIRLGKDQGLMLTINSPDAHVTDIPGGLILLSPTPESVREGTGVVKIDAPGTVLACEERTLALWNVEYDPAVTVIHRGDDELVDSFWKSGICGRPRDGSGGPWVDARNAEAFDMAVRLAGGRCANVTDEDLAVAVLMHQNIEG